MKKLKYLFAIGIILLFFASCKHDDLTTAVPNENVRSAGDFVKNNYETSLFYAALEKVGYIEQLNGPGPFTVLAPTNDAFNGLGIFTAADFDKMNVDSLKRVIGYHLLPRKLLLSDIPTNGVDVRYLTLQGSELYVSRASASPIGAGKNELYFSGAEATRQDVTLANGTLHLLSTVMKPNFDKTVQQWLADYPEYSVFVSGLKKFKLWDQLATLPIVTIFAPDNKALENIGITDASLTTMDASKYLGDLLFGSYILYDRHFFVSDSQVFTVINSKGVYGYFLKNDSHYMKFGAAKVYPTYKLGYSLTLLTGSTFSGQLVKSVSSDLVVKNDNLCSNGVIHHLTDGLVMPDQAIKK